MAIPKSLRRLLHIRKVEEEQRRMQLESALSALHRFENALESAAARNRRGRLLVACSAVSGKTEDRLSGIEESNTAELHAAALDESINRVTREAAGLREMLVSKRVERLQAEILLEEGKARDAQEMDRRGQQSLDDWYQARRQKKKDSR